MIIWLVSLTACTTSAGNFCDVYTVVDMPGSEAVKLERKYQERILTNELYEYQNCPKLK